MKNPRSGVDAPNQGFKRLCQVMVRDYGQCIWLCQIWSGKVVNIKIRKQFQCARQDISANLVPSDWLPI